MCCLVARGHYPFPAPMFLNLMRPLAHRPVGSDFEGEEVALLWVYFWVI